MTTISTTTSVRVPPKQVPFLANSVRAFPRPAAVLPCTDQFGKLNPARPREHALVEEGEQILVLAKWFDREAKPNRVLLSSGPMHVTVNTFIELKSDQTSRRLGDFRIIGIVNVRDGLDIEFIGNVPSKVLPVAVFK